MGNRRAGGGLQRPSIDGTLWRDKRRFRPARDAQLETMLDAEGRTALEKLRSLQGPAFDKAYVLLQSDGHKKLLAIHEEYVRSGRDRERRNVARLTRLLIEEHLEHLEMLRIRLG
ncbi:DUF4142 domain-containing protein [Sinorhizobium sp. CCBAU 05631]|uniref:DUF4142 domain-containing protein n=1 Tax=Sinorhizobium sp. CCBAU 05631 TaxID=794846 RepID=UPI0009FDF84A|nr:DUF4142 domain-containing protein [Sinorhizobium sp. CCBAU 05631]